MLPGATSWLVRLELCLHKSSARGPTDSEFLYLPPIPSHFFSLPIFAVDAQECICHIPCTCVLWPTLRWALRESENTSDGHRLYPLPPRDLMTMCGAKGRHPISAATETPLAQVASAGVPLDIARCDEECAQRERKRGAAAAGTVSGICWRNGARNTQDPKNTTLLSSSRLGTPEQGYSFFRAWPLG